MEKCCKTASEDLGVALGCEGQAVGTGLGCSTASWALEPDGHATAWVGMIAGITAPYPHQRRGFTLAAFQWISSGVKAQIASKHLFSGHFQPLWLRAHLSRPLFPSS